MSSKAEEGVRVTGVIASITADEIPSKFKGKPARAVSRIVLKIERAVAADGSAVGLSLYNGLRFQGEPGLETAYHAGDRVEILTTTASGTHIASIKRLTP